MAEDDGVTRSAVLLLALGEDGAAEVMKYLGPREVQRLGVAMATLTNVDHSQVEDALAKFADATSDSSAFGKDSDEFVRSVLVKALGEDIASGVIERILNKREASGIEGLKWMDAQTVADLIRQEHPQIIATILVHLEPDQASSVIACFTPRLRQDVMLRIATLDNVKPTALKELNDVLTRLLSGSEGANKKSIGGVRVAASIMNFMNSEVESSLIEGIKGFDEEMAQEIVDEMFIFDDISELPDASVQLLLRDIPSESLVIALKGASSGLRNKIYSNMSARAGEMLKEDLENRGPVKLSDVEAQQKTILQLVRKMADDGTIMLSSKGGDEQYV